MKNLIKSIKNWIPKNTFWKTRETKDVKFTENQLKSLIEQESVSLDKPNDDSDYDSVYYDKYKKNMISAKQILIQY